VQQLGAHHPILLCRLVLCAVLTPELLRLVPQQLKDLLQWHITTHGDHLVRPAAQSLGYTLNFELKI
jgi:hypothetical protein